jgi:polygalacturonase
MKTCRTRRGTLARAAIGLALLAAPTAHLVAQTPPPPASPPLPSFPPRTCNVRDHGARGNGSSNDTGAINAAIDACASAGGGTVTFPSGTYMVSSLRLKSNIRLLIQSGATLRARSSGFDSPESNPFDDFQDFGHSHFHNAMIWGERISNVAIEGPGRIDGGNLTSSDSPDDGVGDKQVACKSCNRLLFRNLTQTGGGHFFYLLTDCREVTINDLSLSDGRDGINLVGCRNCEASDLLITDIGDDAIPLKNDFSVGRRLLTENVYLHDIDLESNTNGVQVGSETAGDFRNVWFRNFTIRQAGKAGIGLQTNDGGILENFYIDNITMRRAANPIFINSSARLRTPEDVTIGRVRNIHISNVTATEVVQTNGREPANAATISGRPGIPHENIFLTNVQITYRGGGTFAQGNINPPYSPTNNYNPRSIGTRPAYGFFVRHVRNLQFHNVSVDFESNDLRPAWKVIDVDGLEFDDIHVERAGSGAHPSLVLSNVRSFSMHDSEQFPTVSLANVPSASYSPGGGPPPEAVNVFVEAEGGVLSPPMQSLAAADASGGGYIAVASGNNSQSAPPSSGRSSISFSVTRAGTYRLWGRVIAPTNKDDSFWVRIDNGSWVSWNGINPGSAWHWERVTNDDDDDAVVTVDLSVGTHTLTVAYREDGTRLDRVLITNDPSFEPN